MSVQRQPFSSFCEERILQEFVVHKETPCSVSNASCVHLSKQSNRPCSSQKRGNSGGPTRENRGRVLQLLHPPPKENWGFTAYPGFVTAEQAS